MTNKEDEKKRAKEERMNAKASATIAKFQREGKKCPKCDTVKSIDEFGKSKNARIGINSACKECVLLSWHARKTEAVADWHVLPKGFIPTKENINEILMVDEKNIIRWKVDISAQARKGAVAGDCSQGSFQRIFIKGKRYRGDNLICLMRGEEIPDRSAMVEMERANKAYCEGWMREIESHSAFPDWGFFWVRERARLASVKEYAEMDDETKRIRNERGQRNRCQIKKREGNKRWRRDNADRVRDNATRWRKENQDKLKSYRINPVNKVRNNLRNRFKDIMRSAKDLKGSKFSGLTGCTAKQLGTHLESQFKRGMTWNNYGTHWHVDHILPVACFNQSDDQQRKQCWHFTNLRPLRAACNIAKGAKITEPQMRLTL